jgi:oligopeptidase A
MLRQLLFGAVDMNLHSASFDPYDTSGGDGENSNILQLYRKLAEKFAVMRPHEQDRFLCSFSHIFAGGYSAGYYSYKWAEVKYIFDAILSV